MKFAHILLTLCRPFNSKGSQLSLLLYFSHNEKNTLTLSKNVYIAKWPSLKIKEYSTLSLEDFVACYFISTFEFVKRKYSR